MAFVFMCCMRIGFWVVLSFWQRYNAFNNNSSARVLGRHLRPILYIPMNKGMHCVFAGSRAFFLNCIGLVVRPYETMRGISSHGSYWELPMIITVLSIYFGIATLVKTAAFRPFFLTKQFVSLAVVVVTSAVFSSYCLYLAGRILKGVGKYKRFLLLWSYTLIPTVSWFLATSLLYVLLPPPRTTRPEGIIASIVFLVFSSVILFWKMVLVFLSLRFGLRLTFLRILGAIFFSAPLLAAYGYWTYKIGVFRVPFL